MQRALWRFARRQPVRKIPAQSFTYDNLNFHLHPQLKIQARWVNIKTI